MRDGSVVNRAPILPGNPSSGPNIYTGRLTIAGNSKYREANASGLHSYLYTWGIQTFYVCVSLHTLTKRERGREREREFRKKKLWYPLEVQASLLQGLISLILLCLPRLIHSAIHTCIFLCSVKRKCVRTSTQPSQDHLGAQRFASREHLHSPPLREGWGEWDWVIPMIQGCMGFN